MMTKDVVPLSRPREKVKDPHDSSLRFRTG